MSTLGDAMGRGGRRQPTAPGAQADKTPTPGPASPPQGPGAPAQAPEAYGRSELRRRRDALAEQVTELHWDLGGLAYEMAIRDHFRLDVLVRRAAVLQERDGELAEVERLLRLEDSASAGSCPHCAAPHSRGAIFCWQCGATLMERSSATAEAASGTLDGGLDGRQDGQEASTAVMDALLAPANARASDGTRASEAGPPADE